MHDRRTTVGTSRVLTAVTSTCPMPGRPKMFSTMTAPEIERAERPAREGDRRQHRVPQHVPQADAGVAHARGCGPW